VAVFSIQNDLYTSYSTNGGVSWSNQVLFSPIAYIVQTFSDYEPSLKFCGGQFVAVWRTYNLTSYDPGDIIFSKSVNGINWSYPIWVHPGNNLISETVPTVSCDNTGNHIVVVWTYATTDHKMSVSHDGGNSWNSSFIPRLNTSFSSPIFRIDIAYGNGLFVIAESGQIRNTFSTDLFSYVSSDVGYSWNNFNSSRINWDMPIGASQINDYLHIQFGDGLFVVAWECGWDFNSPSVTPGTISSLVSFSSDGVLWSNYTFVNRSSVFSGVLTHQWDPFVFSAGPSSWIALYNEETDGSMKYSFSSDLITFAPLSVLLPRGLGQTGNGNVEATGAYDGTSFLSISVSNHEGMH
jgi:hypothetical protein